MLHSCGRSCQRLDYLFLVRCWPIHGSIGLSWIKTAPSNPVSSLERISSPMKTLPFITKTESFLPRNKRSNRWSNRVYRRYYFLLKRSHSDWYPLEGEFHIASAKRHSHDSSGLRYNAQVPLGQWSKNRLRDDPFKDPSFRKHQNHRRDNHRQNEMMTRLIVPHHQLHSTFVPGTLRYWRSLR